MVTFIKPNLGGTTSACAENTRQAGRPMDRCWNYLRVRGEYCRQGVLRATQPELPPRARRILKPLLIISARCGTTSACAENTRRCRRFYPKAGNYLRVRGEYGASWAGSTAPWELPPRARRIPTVYRWAQAGKGTTSACAENTLWLAYRVSLARNYLRVRGEYS